MRTELELVEKFEVWGGTSTLSFLLFRPAQVLEIRTLINESIYSEVMDKIIAGRIVSVLSRADVDQIVNLQKEKAMPVLGMAF